jgi:hypothetical protein
LHLLLKQNKIGPSISDGCKGSEMKVISETLHEDGSGWNAVVEIRGVMYVAHYVSNRLTVHLGPYKHAPRRARWLPDAVTAWATKRVAEVLTPAWLDLHRAMYA